jgi:hypothetical protein
MSLGQGSQQHQISAELLARLPEVSTEPVHVALPPPAPGIYTSTKISVASADLPEVVQPAVLAKLAISRLGALKPVSQPPSGVTACVFRHIRPSAGPGPVAQK